MDWVPTLLDVASVPSTQRAPSDGVSLLHTLLEGRTVERDLYWRFKANEQAALRRGQWKYLRISGTEYLFDVVADPQERGNLRTHHPERFAALKADWERWNAGMLPYPDGGCSPDWGRSPGGLFRTGPAVGVNILTPIDQQAEWLARQNPDYLQTHPTVAHRLAEHCQANAIRLPKLKQVETISEILRQGTREAVRAAWGVPVVDMYSTREAGYLALQCPDHEHYHVQAESALVEVLNAAGHPCRAGETGRVYVTPLHNFAMPLIRYDIGDFAEVGPPCPCGRGLPVLTPNSPPVFCRYRPMSSNSSVGNGPAPTRVV